MSWSKSAQPVRERIRHAPACGVSVRQGRGTLIPLAQSLASRWGLLRLAASEQPVGAAEVARTDGTHDRQLAGQAQAAADFRQSLRLARAGKSQDLQARALARQARP